MNIKTEKFKLSLDSDKIGKAWKSAIRSEGGMNLNDLRAVSVGYVQINSLMKRDDETDEEFKIRVMFKNGMLKDITAEVNELNKTKELPCPKN